MYCGLMINNFKGFCLVNAPTIIMIVPFESFFEKFTKIGGSGSNAKHQGSFWTVDCYNL